jgi:exopolysaccharide biosynthesis predicted pyruvyltransferase EpsI
MGWEHDSAPPSPATLARLFCYLLGWYFFTSWSTFYSKLFLAKSQNPEFLTLLGLAWAVLFGSGSRLLKRRPFEFQDVLNTWSLRAQQLWPLALLHINNTYFTYLSLNQSHVQFTYTLKCLEPVFTVALSWYLLKHHSPALQDYASWRLLVLLAIILLGVFASVASDPSFTWPSLISGVLSALVMSCRTVVFKNQSMAGLSSASTPTADQKEEEELTRSSLFWETFGMFLSLSQLAFALFLPIAFSRLLVQALQGYPYFIAPSSDTLWYSHALKASIGHFAYNLCSFAVLSLVAPLTHSLLNGGKRLTTILSNVALFQSPLSLLNGLGMIAAHVGLLWYSLTKGSLRTSAPLSASNLSLTDSIIHSQHQSKRSRHVGQFALFLLLALGAYSFSRVAYYSPRNTQLRSVFSEYTYEALDPNWNHIANNPRPHPSVAERDSNWIQCLTHQRNAFISTVQPLIDPSRPVVLLDLPFHWNLGDSFIWLGELQFLDVFGLQPFFTCDKDNCDLIGLQKRIGNATLLLHGGGNFGDIWRSNAEFRNTLITMFPNNPLLLFPQTVKYLDNTFLERDKEIFANHSQMTLLARSEASLVTFKEHFPRNPSFLCPDAAFMIGPLLPNLSPKYDILFLLRIDEEKALTDTLLEAAFQVLDEAGLRYARVDWYDWRQASPFGPDYAPSVPEDTYANLPSYRLQASNNLLSLGRIIITDRMHAMILSLLMHKPVIGLDNSYGKLSGLKSSFLDGVDSCAAEYTYLYFKRDPLEAVHLAAELLGDPKYQMP